MHERRHIRRSAVCRAVRVDSMECPQWSTQEGTHALHMQIPCSTMFTQLHDKQCWTLTMRPQSCLLSCAVSCRFAGLQQLQPGTIVHVRDDILIVMSGIAPVLFRLRLASFQQCSDLCLVRYRQCRHTVRRGFGVIPPFPPRGLPGERSQIERQSDL